MAIDIIFEVIEQGNYKLCWSFMLEYENRGNPFIKRKMYINLLSKSSSIIVPPSEKIKKITGKIIANSNAKVKDSLHLACAASGKCDYFITCDDKFIKAIKNNKKALKDIIGDIKLFNPIDFVRKELNISVIE